MLCIWTILRILTVMFSVWFFSSKEDISGFSIFAFVLEIRPTPYITMGSAGNI